MPTLAFRAGLSFAAAVIAAAVSIWVASGAAAAWERDAVDFLYRLGGSTVVDVMLGLSKIGSSFVVGGVSAVAVGRLVWRRRLGDALFYGLALGGAGLLVALKPVFDRPRPDVPEILGDFAGSAYPSGHALLVAAVVAALAFIPDDPRRRAAIAAAGGLLALADGLSRVYLGAHFPLDVVGGWAMALAWVAGLAALGRRGRRRTG